MLKIRYIIVLTLAALLLCQGAYAAADKVEDSKAAKVIESGKKTRRLEGATLKIARPILKNTPMVAVMDDIEMMMHCPIGKISRKDNGEFAGKVDEVLKDLMLVEESDDELSHMLIYVSGVEGDRFNELILYIVSPDQTLLYFRGDFTVDGLMKVGELSEQDRKRRIKNKRENGEDDSYLQILKNN